MELRRDGTTLVVVVTERPSIESVDIKGNKDIKTEDLTKSLRNVGLSAAKTLDRATLDDVTQYLTDQYYSRGKYAVKIDTKVVSLPDNRVRVSITITEGSRAKIRQIDIVGNTAFPEQDILKALALTTPNLTSWYSSSDRYARESLQGDLEKITGYFQDRGYANVRIDSVQVAIGPDKRDIFITVNVTQGKVYKLGDVKLGGNLIVPESELQHLLFVQKGQVYSQRLISATEDAIKNRLGAEGFYFAKVDPVPNVDESKNVVNLTLFVDPGNRVYVRRIDFTGTTRTNDEPLRREMRQLEGTWLSNVALDRSKQRLQQQPWVESVDMTTTAVPGTPDEVDVGFAIKERPSATIGGGIGYSAYQKFVLNGNLSDSNFLGTGDLVSVNIDAGLYNKIYSVSQTNPYTTIDELSRTISMSYTNSTQLYAQSSSFGSKNLSLGLTFGYPVSEFQGVSAGLSFQDVDLVTTEASAQEAIELGAAERSAVHRPGRIDLHRAGRQHDHDQQSAVWLALHDCRAQPRMGLQHHQSDHFCRSGHASYAAAELCPSRFRRALLDRELSVCRISAAVARVYDRGKSQSQLWRPPGRHYRDATLQALLCGWPRYGARLPGRHARPGRQQRQPLRR